MWRVGGGALGTCDESTTLQDEATGNVVIDALPYVPLEIYMPMICEEKQSWFVCKCILAIGEYADVF